MDFGKTRIPGGAPRAGWQCQWLIRRRSRTQENVIHPTHVKRAEIEFADVPDAVAAGTIKRPITASATRDGNAAGGQKESRRLSSIAVDSNSLQAESAHLKALVHIGINVVTPVREKVHVAVVTAYTRACVARI